MIKTANLVHSVSRKAGGLFESVRRLVQSLSQIGMDVRVFGTVDEFSGEDLAAWEPVEVKTFKAVWPESFGYSPEFLEELQVFAPDLTHTHGIWLYPSVVTNLYCRPRNHLYVISAHGMLDPWAIQNSALKKAIAYFLYEKAHLHGAACLRALCESEARAIRRIGLKNPIAIIPNGIDLPVEGLPDYADTRPQDYETTGPEDDGTTGQRTEDAGRRTEVSGASSAVSGPWSVVRSLKSNGRKVLLYLGRIHPKKGLVNLVKAWKQVSGQWSVVNGQSSEWVLAIAGWDQGGHEGELKRLASDLGLPWSDARATGLQDHGTTMDRRQRAEDRGQRTEVGGQWSVVSGLPSVVFLGPQFNEAKTGCYRDCDAFVLPSFSEGLPMVVLEAWAWRKPVLITPQCNLPEGFAAQAAIRIEPAAESIAQGLYELFRAPSSALRSLGDNGHELTATRYAWPRIGEQMNQLYEWMLGGGAKPACLADF